MADQTDEHSGKTEGKFYVDGNCIDCDLCHQTAPAHFDRDRKESSSYVRKQPANREEWSLCLQASEECPVEAIKTDKNSDYSR